MLRIAPESRSSLPEKSNFARTCNMLSHYLKEKGSPRALNLEINGKFETSPLRSEEEAAARTTINFFNEKPNQISTQNVKPINLFPQYITRNNNSSEQLETEPESAQMTIFYGGQVLVVEEFSAAKAKELMQVASNGNASTESCGNASALNFLSVPEFVRPQLQPMESDLPIARRASLHRFLSKRKDRAVARGPYQLKKPAAESGKVLFDLNL